MGEGSLDWNDGKAAEIQAFVDSWLRAHQPMGFEPTLSEEQQFDRLLSRRSGAALRHDLKAWIEIHRSIIEAARNFYARHNRYGSPSANGSKNGKASPPRTSATSSASQDGPQSRNGANGSRR